MSVTRDELAAIVAIRVSLQYSRDFIMNAAEIYAAEAYRRGYRAAANAALTSDVNTLATDKVNS